MRGLTIAGVVLIVAGMAALLLGTVHWTETKPLVKAGPIEVNTQEEHHVSFPTVGGVVVLLVGVGLVIAGRKAA